MLKSKLVRNTFWSTTGNGLMAAVSFVASIFVVKNLGPEEFGVLQEMMAYFVLVTNFENIINPNIFKKYILDHPTQTNNLVKTSGLFVSLLGAVITAIIVVGCLFLGLPKKFILLAVLTSGIVFRYSNGMSLHFDAQLETYKSHISLNIGNTIACIYKVVASYLSPTALIQAIAQPIQYLVTMGVHFFQYRRTHVSKSRAELKFGVFFGLASMGLPLFASTFVDILKDRLPFMYLGATASAHDLGLFSAGVKLTEPWLFVASALGISFWPKLVEGKRVSEAKYREWLSLYFGATLYFFFFLGAVSLLFGPQLIHWILGAKYDGALVIFKLQIVALVIQAFNFTLRIVETSQEILMFSLIRNAISLVAMFLLLIFLVPIIGYPAGSYGLILSNFIACILVPLFYPKTRWIVLLAVKSPIESVRIVKRTYYPTKK